MASSTDPATVMNNNSLNTKAGLVFPGDLQSTYQDFMCISAFTYSRDAAGDTPSLTSCGSMLLSPAQTSTPPTVH